MKRFSLPLAGLVAFVAATATLAQPGVSSVSSPDLTENQWWQKEGFGFGQFYYTQFKVKDLGKPMHGGGFAFGGEYVNSTAHVGIGGTFSLAWAMMDDTECKADDRQVGLDLYVPLRISSALTFYAGGGGTVHGFDLDYKDDYGLYGGDKWHQDQLVGTCSLFAGARWRVYEHIFLFAEYRREFGKIDIVCENYVYRADGSHPESELDMAGNRFFVGMGALF